jgi:AcrR family transcriptional regulator
LDAQRAPTLSKPLKRAAPRAEAVETIKYSWCQAEELLLLSGSVQQSDWLVGNNSATTQSEKQGVCLTRKKEIDRDRILDAAESVILESGGRTFTLDAVAARAGISKGGLVYSFPTKDALVRAALEREVTRFQKAVRRRLGDRPLEPFELVLAHIDEALDEDAAATQKAAFRMTALVHAPDMMEPARRYYRALLDPLLSESGAAHEVRHALLAVEGIFLLRGLGFVEVSAAEHNPSCFTREGSLPGY